MTITRFLLPGVVLGAFAVPGAAQFGGTPGPRYDLVPSVRPAMAVLGMLTFLMSWNDFFWPIIALSSQNPTEQVAFQSLATGYAPQQSIIMAGTIYGTIPVLIVFALLGRQIVGGIMQGAVKG